MELFGGGTENNTGTKFTPHSVYNYVHISPYVNSFSFSIFFVVAKYSSLGMGLGLVYFRTFYAM